jgi:hypothetical protein
VSLSPEALWCGLFRYFSGGGGLCNRMFLGYMRQKQFARESGAALPSVNWNANSACDMAEQWAVQAHYKFVMEHRKR